MRAVVQRVSEAAVWVAAERIAGIGKGLCVFLGAGPTDTAATAAHFAARIAGLRIFADLEGRMNLDLKAVNGEVIVVSQFTLYGDTSRGHRPSFVKAAPPEQARELCDLFAQTLRDSGLRVAEGRFGAHMDVRLQNDGPVTLVLSTGEPAWPADCG